MKTIVRLACGLAMFAMACGGGGTSEPGTSRLDQRTYALVSIDGRSAPLSETTQACARRWDGLTINFAGPTANMIVDVLSPCSGFRDHYNWGGNYMLKGDSVIVTVFAGSTPYVLPGLIQPGDESIAMSFAALTNVQNSTFLFARSR